ncbi:MAG: M56 family metallopeptidase [Rickettsiales bacterium]|jgi:Zn-dependent protease with chaperone function|nr:M56 family metallopeptidase [Rickettsiales bacterium]
MFAGIPLEKKSIISIVLLIFLFINLMVVLALIFDLMCGFTTKAYIKNTIHYLKIKNYELLTKDFEELKLQFKMPKVELRVSNSEEINAFAVGSFHKKYIVITKGLVSTYLMANKGKLPVFLLNMRCIMGHEMSHLINKDYMPAILLQLNQSATLFVSNLLVSILNMFLGLVQYIPFIGKTLAYLIVYFYKGIKMIINAFHKYVIFAFYKFLQLKISRTNEYRCDMQSSIACGGRAMAATLAELGDSGYTTIFSTHPSTKSRIKHVMDVQRNGNLISPAGKNFLINTIVILFVLFVPLILWYFVDMNGLMRNYQTILMNLGNRYRNTKDSLMRFLEKVKAAIISVKEQ